MSKIRTFLHILNLKGIQCAVTAAWRFSIGGEKSVPRFELEREWLRILADGQNLTGAEVGVRDGRNAAYLIDALDIGQLYLIDPYETYDDYPDIVNDDVMTEFETSARERLGGFKSVDFIRKYSSDAITDIAEDLDFVYIDGNHEYEFVKNDIENYYPLLKEGGILAGHDYTESKPGVVKAVDEFSQKQGLQVKRAIFTDWFFVVPISE